MKENRWGIFVFVVASWEKMYIKYHDGQYVTVIQANKLHYETIRAFFHSCTWVGGWGEMNLYCKIGKN